MLNFIKISSMAAVTDYLADTITKKLQSGERVLWLVPGGSSIAIAAEVSRRLQAAPLKRLTVTLTDERYGNEGHPDSNWLQLKEAGFTLPGSVLLPVLDGSDMPTTVTRFAEKLLTSLAEADYKIGFFGIGADGHIAGALPGSPAVMSEAYAVGYDAGAYQRITMTPFAIAKLDEAVVYAVGEAKWPIFDQLDTDLSLSRQPAQILKQVPKTTICNDYKGEPA